MKTSKVNCKHQKSIANSKIWIQFWEQIAISVCFCCCSERKRREIVTMNLRSHATLRIEHFHQKAMFIKVHLDFVHEFQVQLKGVVPKTKATRTFMNIVIWEMSISMQHSYIFEEEVEVPVDLWEFQLTFIGCNWLYSIHMIHYK